jgi:hypothetical protein
VLGIDCPDFRDRYQLKTMNRLRTALALTGISLLSCMAPPPADPRIMLLEGTRAFLDVSNARVMNVNGVQMFVADLTNTSPVLTHRFVWRVEFRNNSGTQVATSDTRWQTLQLTARESRQVQIAASNPLAVDFIFTARRN